MKPWKEIKSMAQRHPSRGPADPNSGGYFVFVHKLVPLRVIASWIGGWDHVSVSLPDRCPTWDEMSAVKRRFFRPEEHAMQLHPSDSDHINIHPYCLHLWRPHSNTIPLPPKEFV